MVIAQVGLKFLKTDKTSSDTKRFKTYFHRSSHCGWIEFGYKGKALHLTIGVHVFDRGGATSCGEFSSNSNIDLVEGLLQTDSPLQVFLQVHVKSNIFCCVSGIGDHLLEVKVVLVGVEGDQICDGDILERTKNFLY